MTPAMSLRSADCAARTISAALTLRSTTKAKSRSTGWNGDSSSAGLARVGLRLRLGDALEDHFEADQRAFGIERFERARMQFAEMAEHVLRPDLDRAGAAGMKPGRPARHHLQRLRRRAGRGQHAERIGLGVEGIDLAVALAPMPADAGGLCQRAPDAGGGGELILRPIAAKHLADFEQSRYRESRGRRSSARRRPGRE